MKVSTGTSILGREKKDEAAEFLELGVSSSEALWRLSSSSELSSLSEGCDLESFVAGDSDSDSDSEEGESLLALTFISSSSSLDSDSSSLSSLMSSFSLSSPSSVSSFRFRFFFLDSKRPRIFSSTVVCA